MPKKAPGEKWRYIAFRIEGETVFPRNDFLGALLKKARETTLGNSFRITVYGRNFGILKVPHKLKEAAIETLTSVDAVRGVPCSVRTLKTSGTIRKLKRKYAELIDEVEGY